MIYVCEPQCKQGSHESFNSGFLHGLYEVYNDVCFYAEKTHIQYIKSYLNLRNSQCVNNIVYREITFPNNIYSFRQLIFYKKIFKSILNQISENDKMLLLSANPMILFLLCSLSKKDKYKNIVFNIVLHGGIEEELAPYILPKCETINNNRNIKKSGVLNKLSRISEKSVIYLFKYSVKTIWQFFRHSIIKPYITLYKALYNHRSFFSESRDLSSFNFIVLSKHILDNLHIDNKTFKMKLCYLPCIFPPKTTDTVNDYPKFAIFGYGVDNGLFEDFLDQLDKLNPSKRYEIRLVSMRGYSGIGKYRNITFNNNGFIPRQEYEKMAEDIDYFINFYDPSQYRLSCSGSIIESIMYRKPVIYIGNECYDSFNSLAGPIGIMAGSTQNFASIVFNIIENWPEELQRINEFKRNIEDVIQIIDISTQLKNDKSIIA